MTYHAYHDGPTLRSIGRIGSDPWANLSCQGALFDLYPELYGKVGCPIQGCPTHTSLKRILQHLVDAHCVSREVIADWIQALEDARGDAAKTVHITPVKEQS